MIDEEYTRQLLSEGEKFVEYRDEVILVIGNSGSGKSAFVQYIATDMSKLEILNSKIVSTDKHIRSSPNFPTLFEYKGHNFYDCPGFDDTIDKPHALVAAHFINKLLEKAKKVKLVLVVEHSSIISSSYVDFNRFLEHLNLFVRKFHKFSESTFLVATKLPLRVRNADNKVIQYSEHEDKIIKVISENLTEIKNNLQSGETFFQGDRSNAVSLLTSLSNKTRLFLFWSPTYGCFDADGFMVTKKVPIENGILTAPYTASSYPGEFPSPHQCTIKKLAARSTEIIIRQITDIKDNLLVQCDLQAINSLRELRELASRLESKRMVLGKTKSNMIKERHLAEIVSELNNGLRKLNVKESSKGLGVIEKQIDVLRLLQAFKNNDIDIKPSNWLREITGSLSVTPELNTCERFLSYLYLELSKYDSQKSPILSNVEHLSWGETEMDDMQENVTDFIEKLRESFFKENQELPDPDLIRGATLDQLNNILSLTVRQKVALQPVDGVITVKQNIIILSDVVEALNEAAYAGMNVKLFATDTIFIDCSLESPSLNLTFIAPTIKVIGRQKMLLKGLNHIARDPLRSDSSVYSSDGYRQIGINFSAITMSSLGGLTLDFTAEIVENHQSEAKTVLFQYGTDGPNHLSQLTQHPSAMIVQDFLPLNSMQDMQCDSMASNPHKINTGLVPIKAGNAGSVASLGSFFTTSPGLEIVQHEANVYSSYALIKKEPEGDMNEFHASFPSHNEPVKHIEQMKTCILATNNAPNSYGCSKSDGSKIALDATNYKLYASQMGQNPFFHRSLSAFRNQVLGTDKLDPLYKTPALLNEMMMFEKESDSCGQATRFVSLYVDLLQRVARYSSRLNQNVEPDSDLTRKSLQVLYTGILARVCSLKRSLQHTLVEETTQLTHTTMTNQENLKDKNYIEMLILERENYGLAVKERIGQVEALINRQLIADIDAIIKETRSPMKQSLESKGNSRDRYVDPLKLEQYENSLNHALMMGLVKNIALIIHLSVSYCEVANHLIQESFAIDVPFIEVDEIPANLDKVHDGMISLDRLEEEAKKSSNKRKKGLEELISTMQRKINKYILTFQDQKVLPADEPWRFEGFKYTLSNLLISVIDAQAIVSKEKNEVTTNDVLVDVESTLDKIEDAINQALETETVDLEDRHKSYKSVKNQNEKDKETKERNLLNELKQLKKIYTTFGDDYTDYSRFVSLIETTTELDPVLVELHGYSRKVRQTLISLFKSMREEMTRIKSTLSEKRQVVLDVAKWDLRSQMSDLKRILEKLSSRFVKEEKFNPLFTKADDAMTTMILVQDSIDNYKNQAELAANISYMNDRGFGIENPSEELTPSIQYLHLVIKSNLDRFKACAEPLKENPSPLPGSTSS